MSNILKTKLAEWFPDRLGWSHPQLFYSLSEWKASSDVIEALFKGLHAEEYRAKRAAGIALSKTAAGDDSIRARLEIVANNSDDPYIVAAAMESLMTGWSSHSATRKLIDRAAISAVPELRLVGIRGRITLGVQQEEDLDALLKLADANSPFRIGLGGDVREALLKGWPANERIKQMCLESSGRVIYGGPRQQLHIDRETALYVLLAGYPMDEQVAAFCIDQLTNDRHPFLSLHGYEPYEMLAKNFPNHPGIMAALDAWAEKAESHRAMEMSSAALLGRTSVLKRKLIEALKNKGSFPHWPARGLLEAWGMADPEVASALTEFISNPVSASDDIVCAGPDFEERRLAAFCGLVILDRLDLMDSRQEYGVSGGSINIRSIRGFDVNIPAVRFLLKHWEKLQNHFKDQFWQRLFGGDSTEYLWDKLCTLADEYPSPRRQVIEFYRGKSEKVAGSSALQFLARVQPASGLLLEYCLNTLGLDKPETPMPAGRQNITHVNAGDQLTAAQILGRHFADDTELPRRLCAEKNELRFDPLVLALSEGWPASEALSLCFKEMAKSRRGYWQSTVLRYYCFKAHPIGMDQVLRKWMRGWVSRPHHRLHESFVDPIVWRLQHDKKLRDILLRHISVMGTPSEKISICRLLYKAFGAIPELRTWAQSELKKQFLGSGTESGLDTTTGEVASLPHVLYAVLNG